MNYGKLHCLMTRVFPSRTNPDSCRPDEVCDATAQVRKFSHFDVYCVVKNTINAEIPNFITIQPEAYNDTCSVTEFGRGKLPINSITIYNIQLNTGIY